MKIDLHLYPTPPYDFQRSFSYLEPCADPVCSYDGTTFQRLWPLGRGRLAHLTLSSLGTVEKPRLKLRLAAEFLSEEDVANCARRAEEIFCLKLDLRKFYRTIKKDKTLYAHTQRNIGLKPVLEPTLFEALTWAIIGQQVNLRFACVVKQGMLERFGQKRKMNGQTFYGYPEPADLAGQNPDSWREFKSSRRKAEYIIGLADLLQDGFDLEGLKRLSDEKIIEELVKIRGIGRWTAEYVLIQGFGRWDALPVGDAGLVNGIRRAYGLKHRPDEKEVEAMGERWRPYRGLATYYLWWGKQFKHEDAKNHKAKATIKQPPKMS